MISDAPRTGASLWSTRNGWNCGKFVSTYGELKRRSLGSSVRRRHRNRAPFTLGHPATRTTKSYAFTHRKPPRAPSGRPAVPFPTSGCCAASSAAGVRPGR
jgi:hypothetical protein